ncbi:MAG: nicotinate phosphoribosyltransferase [Aquabacterium sp.]
MPPIIDSLLDTDLYKFTMWQVMLHRHPSVQAEYRFTCRNRPAYPLAELADDVGRELDALCALQFTDDELAYIGRLRYIKSDFVEFLRIFRFQRRFIEVRADGHALRIEARGPQVHVMAFELFVLAIVNELYFRRLPTAGVLDEGRRRLAAKIAQVQAYVATPGLAGPLELFEFGMRRRYSAAWQRELAATLQQALPGVFKGISNVRLARDLGLAPIGTMAHEYLQTYQGLPVRLREHQRAALEDWVQEYRGDLGIALTDVIGIDAFLADFDLYFAKLFDGLRHDSGDPVAWGEKALAHYAQLGLDARNKRFVFSDGLTVPAALALHRHFAGRVQLGFGIGTQLTNDLGPEPLNIVMKLVRANGQPVAKVSDSPGKAQCDDAGFLAYLRQVFAMPA